MNGYFYELVQVSIGTLEKFSGVPTAEDWNNLFYNAKEQALVGICFYGIQWIYKRYPTQAVNLTSELRMKWLSLAVNIQRRNEILNKQCQIVQQQFLESGLESCVLKGQGIATFYNEKLSTLRQSGDIDVWVNGSWKDVLDYVNARTPNREFDKKHTHYEVFKDTIVEVHWWPSVAVNPLYARKIKDYYKEQVHIQCNHTIALHDGSGMLNVPEAKFELVHVVSHIFNHFLYEGIGLRQLLDLYFVLQNGNLSKEDMIEVQIVLKRIGLEKFIPGLMWVLKTVFLLNDKYIIGSIDENLGRILLKDIELGGNFGKYNNENIVRDESFVNRMKRRYYRRLKLFRFNVWGVVFSPLTKLEVMLWRYRVIKMYKL